MKKAKKEDINILRSNIWPQDKNFAVWLTHDVDRVNKHLFHVLYYFAKEKRKYHLLSKFEKKDPYWNFENIKDIESKYNIKSTFFFLNETKKFNIKNKAEWKLTLGRYDLHDSEIKDEIIDLNSSGWEIGLHGSYESYNSEELLRKEKEELEDVPLRVARLRRLKARRG